MKDKYGRNLDDLTDENFVYDSDEMLSLIYGLVENNMLDVDYVEEAIGEKVASELEIVDNTIHVSFGNNKTFEISVKEL